MFSRKDWCAFGEVADNKGRWGERDPDRTPRS